MLLQIERDENKLYLKRLEAIACAGETFATVKIKGISLNTFHLDLEEAKTAIAKVQEEIGLPCIDVTCFLTKF